jgi:23S rRNA (adenine2503-C2)-methyltransferase
LLPLAVGAFVGITIYQVYKKRQAEERGDTSAQEAQIKAEAVRRIIAELGIGARRITIRTVGLVPRIKKLAEEDIQFGLAVSLHQTQDAARSALMPVNMRYNIAELLRACKDYTHKTKRRVTFEWALIQDQTDSSETAHELGKLCAKKPF